MIETILLHITNYQEHKVIKASPEELIKIKELNSNGVSTISSIPAKELKVGRRLAEEFNGPWYLTKIQTIPIPGFEEAIAEIKKAYEEAVKKHGTGFTSDPIHAAALVAEEAGEAIQAANNYYHEATEPIDKFREELAQTGAIVIRALMAIPSYTTSKDMNLQLKEYRCFNYD